MVNIAAGNISEVNLLEHPFGMNTVRSGILFSRNEALERVVCCYIEELILLDELEKSSFPPMRRNESLLYRLSIVLMIAFDAYGRESR